MTEKKLSTIAISMGDPAGIGPEVTLKALADPQVFELAQWIVVGEARILQATANQLSLAVPGRDRLRILDLAQPAPGEYVIGRAMAACGAAAVAYVRAATQLCLQGKADALVTAPLNKQAVALTGQPFTGHTEFIAELCGVAEPRMLLVNDRFSVIHVTTHVALRKACDLTREGVVRTILLGHEAMRRLGVERPRIAVCGLNPHAGEDGLFGEEDREVVGPAVRIVSQQGITADGPIPADTVFLKAARGAYDLVVAMYHDQGHIPMKLLDFEHTVNVSLGLPIVRTSVDHGTAYDIAGQGCANPASMKAAIRLAVRQASPPQVPPGRGQASPPHDRRVNRRASSA